MGESTWRGGEAKVILIEVDDAVASMVESEVMCERFHTPYSVVQTFGPLPRALRSDGQAIRRELQFADHASGGAPYGSIADRSGEEAHRAWRG